MFLVPMTRNSQELARSFDRLFDDGFFDQLMAPARAEASTNPNASANARRSPALEVREADTRYTVTLDLPGVAKDDVKIAIDGKRVSIEAQATHQVDKKDGERVVYSERSAASYARSFTLPAEVNEADSSATLTDGVLTLTLAKKGATKAVPLKVQ